MSTDGGQDGPEGGQGQGTALPPPAVDPAPERANPTPDLPPVSEIHKMVSGDPGGLDLGSTTLFGSIDGSPGGGYVPPAPLETRLLGIESAVEKLRSDLRPDRAELAELTRLRRLEAEVEKLDTPRPPGPPSREHGSDATVARVAAELVRLRALVASLRGHTGPLPDRRHADEDLPMPLWSTVESDLAHLQRCSVCGRREEHNRLTCNHLGPCPNCRSGLLHDRALCGRKETTAEPAPPHARTHAHGHDAALLEGLLHAANVEVQDQRDSLAEVLEHRRPHTWAFMLAEVRGLKAARAEVERLNEALTDVGYALNHDDPNGTGRAFAHEKAKLAIRFRTRFDEVREEARLAHLEASGLRAEVERLKAASPGRRAECEAAVAAAGPRSPCVCVERLRVLEREAEQAEAEILAERAVGLPLQASTRTTTIRRCIAALAGIDCDHTDIGMPGCPVCDPRPRKGHEGGALVAHMVTPVPGAAKAERERILANASRVLSAIGSICPECGGSDTEHDGGCVRSLAQPPTLHLTAEAIDALPRGAAWLRLVSKDPFPSGSYAYNAGRLDGAHLGVEAALAAVQSEEAVRKLFIVSGGVDGVDEQVAAARALVKVPLGGGATAETDAMHREVCAALGVELSWPDAVTEIHRRTEAVVKVPAKEETAPATPPALSAEERERLAHVARITHYEDTPVLWERAPEAARAGWRRVVEVIYREGWTACAKAGAGTRSEAPRCVDCWKLVHDEPAPLPQLPEVPAAVRDVATEKDSRMLSQPICQYIVALDAALRARGVR